MNPIQHFTRFIHPFTFDESIIDVVVKRMDGQQMRKKSESGAFSDVGPIWTKFDPNETDTVFLPHIQVLLSEYRSERYIYRRRLDPEVLTALFQAEGAVKHLTAKMNNNHFELKIIALEVYLFRSGFGFIIVEMVVLSPSDISQIIDFNYCLKHDGSYSSQIHVDLANPHPKLKENLLQKKEQLILGLTETGFPEELTKIIDIEAGEKGQLFSTGCSMNEFYSAFLSMIFTKALFRNNLTGNQSFVFNYCFAGQAVDKDSLNGHLFRLRRVVRNHYLPAESDLDDTSEEILHTFRNVHIGMAIEGCTVLVEDVGNPFFHQFTDRVKNRYFILYLLALHNRMALLNYRHKVEVLIPDAFHRVHITKELIQRIRELRNQMVGFYNNAFFIQISNSTTFENMYARMIDVLYIEKLLAEIRTKTEELDGMVDMHLERRSNNLISLITIIGFVFAPLAIVAEILGINLRLGNDPGHGFYFTWQFAVFLLALCLVASSVFILILLLRSRERSSKRKRAK